MYKQIYFREQSGKPCNIVYALLTAQLSHDTVEIMIALTINVALHQCVIAVQLLVYVKAWSHVKIKLF